MFRSLNTITLQDKQNEFRSEDFLTTSLRAGQIKLFGLAKSSLVIVMGCGLYDTISLACRWTPLSKRMRRKPVITRYATYRTINHL